MIDHAGTFTANQIYMGKNAGRYISYDIQDCQHSIKIVTPYISKELLDLIAKKSSNGIEVSLVLSSDVIKKPEELSRLIVQNRHIIEKACKKRTLLRKANTIYTISIIITTILLMHIIHPLYIIVATSLILSAALRKLEKKIRIFSYEYQANYNTAIITSPYNAHEKSEKNYLIHAKLFIIDNQKAYLGSLNFTNAGFQHNYESLIKFTDQQTVNLLLQEFYYLQSNQNTNYANIAHLGRQIYSEPPN